MLSAEKIYEIGVKEINSYVDCMKGLPEKQANEYMERAHAIKWFLNELGVISTAQIYEWTDKICEGKKIC